MTTERRDHAAPAGDGGHARRSGDADDARRAEAARARLEDLQHSAAEAYAAITVADDALRVLARQRVTAERVLRLAAAHHQAAWRAAAAHARARPGPFAQLATRFRVGREWRQARPALETALADTERQLVAARQALSEAMEDFAARLAARTAAATTLRRLTGECAATRAQIDGSNPPDAAPSVGGQGESRR
jgi:hypothetical protein